MAYSIIKQNDDSAYNLVELVIDFKADIETLPTTYAAGSDCICIEDSSVYMLGNDKIWHEL